MLFWGRFNILPSYYFQLYLLMLIKQRKTKSKNLHVQRMPAEQLLLHSFNSAPILKHWIYSLWSILWQNKNFTGLNHYVPPPDLALSITWIWCTHLIKYRGMKSLEPWFSSSPICTTSNWLTSLVEWRVFWFTSNSSKPYQSVVVYLPLSHRGGEPNQSVVIYLPLSFRGGEPNQSVVIYSPLPRR